MTTRNKKQIIYESKICPKGDVPQGKAMKLTFFQYSVFSIHVNNHFKFNFHNSFTIF